MSDDFGSLPATPSVPTGGHDAALLTGWHRFRDDEDERFGWVDWPEGCGDVRDLLVWNPCDGYHIWSRYFGDTPPGTHYARLLAKPILTESPQ